MNPRAFTNPFHGGSGRFQFSMNHLEKALLFRSPEDYVFGVNSIAIGSHVYDVSVLSYALMDTHFHLLVEGAYDRCEALCRWLIRRLRRMLSDRYGVKGLLDEDAFDVSAMRDDEMSRNEVAYIVRNPYKARMASPLSYSWSSADVYFNPQRDLIQGTPLSAMKQDMIKAVFHTHDRLPPEWEHVNGRILNRCFVDYAAVEQLFGSSVTYFDRIRKYDLESVVQMNHGLAESIRFTDQEMQEKILSLCQNEYHVASHNQLDAKTLLILARALARRFSCSKTQIGRLLGLSGDVLDRLL